MRVTVVILCVCVSVATLAATYLICESNLQCSLWCSKWVIYADFSKYSLFASYMYGVIFADSKLLRLAIAWLYVLIECCVLRAVYGMYVLLILSACTVGKLLTAAFLPPSSPATGELLTDEADNGGYVWLAIDPTRWLAHHWLEHSGSADLASMISLGASPFSSHPDYSMIASHWYSQGGYCEGSWLDIGTA